MVTPDDLHSLALELALRPDEPGLRAAISRAYYAAFLRLRDGARSVGLLRARGTAADHGRLATLVAARDPVTAQRLTQLRVLRNRADYDLEDTILDHDAAYACVLAMAVLRSDDRFRARS